MAERKAGIEMNYMQLALPGTAVAAGFSGSSGTLAAFCGTVDFAIGTLPGEGGLFTFEGGRALGAAGDDCVTFAIEAGASILEGAGGRIFPSDAAERIDCPPGDNQFVARLAGMMPSPNYGYAVRVEGTFARVRVTTRSGMRRWKEHGQRGIRTLEGAKGILLGFYLPPCLGPVAWAGCRFHFLTDDRAVGGRLVDCEIERPSIALRHVDECRIAIPGTADYHLAELGGGRSEP